MCFRWQDIFQAFTIGFLLAVMGQEIIEGNLTKAALTLSLITINILSFAYRNDRKRSH